MGDRQAVAGALVDLQRRMPDDLDGRARRGIEAPDEFPHREDCRRVTSFIELEPAGDATRVRLTSTGYPDNEGGRALLSFFARGNAATLDALRRSVAKPEDLPAP